MEGVAMKVLRIFDLSVGLRDLDDHLRTCDVTEILEAMHRVIDTRDELVAALVDFGLPTAELPVDDTYALIEVSNKIVLDALTVED